MFKTILIKCMVLGEKISAFLNLSYIGAYFSKFNKRFSRINSESEEVINDSEALAFLPAGFKNTFDMKAHPALKDIQKKAVYAIFDRYKISWVPAAYLDILKRYQDPTMAFIVFCNYHGIQINKIVKNEPTEILFIQEVAYLLVEMDRIPLSGEDRFQVIQLLKNHDIDTAKEYIERAHFVFQAIRSATGDSNAIQIAVFKSFVNDFVTPKIQNIFVIDNDDIIQIQNMCKTFWQIQEQLNQIRFSIDKSNSWFEANWINDQRFIDKYLDDYNKTTINIEKCLSDLYNNDKLRLDDIAELLNELNSIAAFLNELEEEIKLDFDPNNKSGGTGSQTYSGNSIEVALEYFGFSKNYKPSKDEIKKTYRKLVFKKHPDRFANVDEDTKKQIEEDFKRLQSLYDILKLEFT